MLQSLFRPVLRPIMMGVMSVTGSRRAWTPAALWPTGTEPGMWIDPSNLTSQWQDSAGTTPVSTPGTVADSSNPVGLALDLRLGATALTDPGNHLLQATSTARPLLSAYDGQTLGPGNTYDATGYPIFQKYDGTDDGMATASFAAGTLTSDMDCLIAVRRDAGSNMVIGFHRSAESNQYIAATGSGQAWPATAGAGTPTTWVDGVQLSGGTSTSADDLNTALTVGDWHVLELRGLDLSAWTDLRFGYYGWAWDFNGALGGILLFPGGNTAGRDAARAWLAAKVGVTLP